MLYKVQYRYKPHAKLPNGTEWADCNGEAGTPRLLGIASARRNHLRKEWGHVAEYRLVRANEERRRELIYVAHPVGEHPLMNCFNALQWVRWLTANEPTRVYIAPWIAEVLAHLDVPGIVPGSEMWEKVLSNDEQVVDRCDGILLVGGRVSVGMARERDRAVAAKSGKSVTDLSQYRSPNDLPDGFFLDPAYEE